MGREGGGGGEGQREGGGRRIQVIAINFNIEV